MVRVRDGFIKWMVSTKFQVAILSFTLIYLAIPLFMLEPQVAVNAIRDIAIAYMATRVLEPIVQISIAGKKK
jgi:hypothetical protein